MYDSVFCYDSFVVSDDRKHVVFNFTIQKSGETFTLKESYLFPAPLPDSLESYRLLRALHLASGTSYYKIFYCQEIEHPYAMSTREAGMWNTVFRHGLGEFLYVNKLDPTNIAVFGPQEGHDTKNTTRIALESKALLGIGGGKDSVVAGELLKSITMSTEGFVLATKDAIGQAADITKTMKLSLHVVQRTLDPLLLTLQERSDAYKGHVPISLLFALVGGLVALTRKCSYVVVANEASASIPRSTWAGTSVNHQWSKSFDFEKLLQDYIHESVSKQLSYFSAIRPLSSVAVSKLFARHPLYFEVFTSDNYAFRIDADKRPEGRWSLQSPKSLSSFILLSAWLNETDLVKIFGHNFLNEASLKPLFLSLTGVEGEPPLDCVGTPEELRASLGQAYKRNIFTSSILMQTAKEYEIIADDRDIAPTAHDLLKLGDEQAFPPEIAEKLQQAIQKELEA